MSKLPKIITDFGPSDFVDNSNPQLTNWANACPPHSPLRAAEINDPSGKQIPPMANHRSFIHNHPAAMDICNHPEIMPLHGYTTSIGTNLGELVPLFTFAKTVVHSDILATPLEQYSSTYIGDDPDWQNKTMNKVLWRGSTTGVEFAEHVQWQLSQRARLHFLSHQSEGDEPVLYAENNGKMRMKAFPVKDLNENYLVCFLSRFMLIQIAKYSRTDDLFRTQALRAIPYNATSSHAQ